MKDHMALTGEASAHKVAGIVDDEGTARELAAQVREQAGLGEAQVMVLGPGDDAVGRALEPESRGIWHTLIRAHVWLALAGGLLGALAYLLLLGMDVGFIVLNPLASGALLVCFGVVGGLMLGGALVLRPDHSPYVMAARAALDEGRYVVVVHASNMAQLKDAEAVLERVAGKVVRTL